MKLIYTIILLSLSGCFYQSVDSHDIKQAHEACKDHEGIYKINADWVGSEIVYCADNFYTRINWYK